MSAHGDPAAVEATLLRSAEKARARGLAIVYGAFEERLGDDGDVVVGGGTLTGVCALGAHNLCHDGESLALPDGDEFSDAYDAIQDGFDDSPVPAENDPAHTWWWVGNRLRAKLNPREART